MMRMLMPKKYWYFSVGISSFYHDDDDDVDDDDDDDNDDDEEHTSSAKKLKPVKITSYYVWAVSEVHQM